MSILGRLPLPAATAVVAALGIAGILLGRFLDLGIFSLATLAVPVAVALLYLREYSRKELRRPPPTPLAPPTPPPEPGGVPAPPTIEPAEPPPRPDEVTLTLFDEPLSDVSPERGTLSKEESERGTAQEDSEGRTNNSG